MLTAGLGLFTSTAAHAGNTTRTTFGNHNLGAGNTADVATQTPVSACGNASAVLGAAVDDSCAGGATAGADLPGVTSSDNFAVGTGNQLVAPAQIPVDACGNAVSAGGDATSGGCAGGTTAGLHANDAVAMATYNNYGTVSGNQVLVPVVVPVNVCGNALASGTARTQGCVGGAKAHVPAQALTVSENSPGPLSGMQYYGPIVLPVNLCGQSVGVFADTQECAPESAAAVPGTASAAGTAGTAEGLPVVGGLPGLDTVQRLIANPAFSALGALPVVGTLTGGPNLAPPAVEPVQGQLVQGQPAHDQQAQGGGQPAQDQQVQGGQQAQGSPVQDQQVQGRRAPGKHRKAGTTEGLPVVGSLPATDSVRSVPVVGGLVGGINADELPVGSVNLAGVDVTSLTTPGAIGDLGKVGDAQQLGDVNQLGGLGALGSLGKLGAPDLAGGTGTGGAAPRESAPLGSVLNRHGVHTLPAIAGVDGLAAAGGATDVGPAPAGTTDTGSATAGTTGSSSVTQARDAGPTTWITHDNSGFVTGNQVGVPVLVPVTVDGNTVAAVGTAQSGGAGGGAMATMQ